MLPQNYNWMQSTLAVECVGYAEQAAIRFDETHAFFLSNCLVS